MSISRRDGVDMRLSMMADDLVALPKEIFNKILGILGVNEAATRIQRFARGVLVKRTFKGVFGFGWRGQGLSGRTGLQEQRYQLAQRLQRDAWMPGRLNWAIRYG